MQLLYLMQCFISLPLDKNVERRALTSVVSPRGGTTDRDGRPHGRRHTRVRFESRRWRNRNAPRRLLPAVRVPAWPDRATSSPDPSSPRYRWRSDDACSRRFRSCSGCICSPGRRAARNTPRTTRRIPWTANSTTSKAWQGWARRGRPTWRPSCCPCRSTARPRSYRTPRRFLRRRRRRRRRRSRPRNDKTVLSRSTGKKRNRE